MTLSLVGSSVGSFHTALDVRAITEITRLIVNQAMLIEGAQSR
jgi:hypothetical protein